MMLDCFEFFAFRIDTDVQISSADKFCHFINQLREQGYALVDGYAWPFTDPENIISDPTQTTARILEGYRDHSSMIQENFWKYPFEFSFSLDHVNGEIWILRTQFDTLTGPNRDLGERNALEFLKVIRKSLESYPPYFGCGYSRDPDISFVDLDTNFKATDIYDINFYSSAYIEHHLDREHLLATPAWCIEEIGNGVLLVPSLCAIYTDDPESLDAVKKYLKYI